MGIFNGVYREINEVKIEFLLKKSDHFQFFVKIFCAIIVFIYI